MSCTICTVEFEENKNTIFLDCGHKFHCKCFFTLLSYNDKKCPLCRHNIEYEVAVSNIQERLTTSERECRDLVERNEVVIYEYIRLRELQTTTELKHSLEIQLKDSKILRFKRENIRARREITGLRSENMELKKNNNPNILIELISKNTEINLLKNDLMMEQRKYKKLENQVDKITTNNIKHSNDMDKSLSQLMNKIRELDTKNDNNRFTNHNSRFDSATYSSLSRSSQTTLSVNRSRVVSLNRSRRERRIPRRPTEPRPTEPRPTTSRRPFRFPNPRFQDEELI